MTRVHVTHAWAARAVTLMGVIAGLAGSAAAAPSTAVHFSDEERSRILAHGPWPPPRSSDASNRVDGRSDAVKLGRQLFFDKRLSASGQLACASCHNPTLGFQDGRRFSRHGRNTPSLLDAGQQRWLGWDGASDSLWAASLAPLTAADELAATPAQLAALLQRDRTLRTRYRRLFGPVQADEQLPVHIAKALAAYQATLVTPRTPFDDFRDALSRGNRPGQFAQAARAARAAQADQADQAAQAAQARYPAAAQRDLKIFVGSGRCFFCHTGPGFSNGEFADIGRPFFTAAGADSGRWGGLQQLLSSPHTRLGKFSDTGADDPRALSTRHVVLEPRHFGEFKVPTLRGLTASAPYFHDGSAATLEDAVRHYSELDESRLHADGVRLLQALRLSPAELADLTAFLQSLSAAPARRTKASQTR